MELIERMLAGDLAKSIVDAINLRWFNLYLEGWEDDEAVEIVRDQLVKDQNFKDLVKGYLLGRDLMDSPAE